MAYSIQSIKTNVASDVLNYGIYNVNNSLGTSIPYYTESADLRAIGAQITGNPNILNSFSTALVNQIARIIVQSRTYNNHFNMFKKGINEYGDSIEEVFVNMAKAFHFDPDESAAGKFMQREKPDVKSVFHIVNFKEFYKITVSQAELKLAMTSIDALSNFVSRIVEQLYTAMNYDDEQMFKYLLAMQFRQSAVPCEMMYGETIKTQLSALKTAITKMSWLGDKYNIAHVKNRADSLYCLLDSDFNAEADVEVLAAAFNLSYVDFLPRKLVVDTFVPDVERINALLDTSYAATDFDNMADIHCVVVDEEFFQCYDNLLESDEFRNPEGRYTNFFLHAWRTYAVSPFACAFAINGINYSYSRYATVKFATTKDGAITGTSLTHDTQYATGATTTTAGYVAITIPKWSGEQTPKIISAENCTAEFVGEGVDSNGNGCVILHITGISTTTNKTKIVIAPWGDTSAVFNIKLRASAS